MNKKDNKLVHLRFVLRYTYLIEREWFITDLIVLRAVGEVENHLLSGGEVDDQFFIELIHYLYTREGNPWYTK